MKLPEVPGGKNRGKNERTDNIQRENVLQYSNTGRRHEFMIQEIQLKMWNKQRKDNTQKHDAETVENQNKEKILKELKNIRQYS